MDTDIQIDHPTIQIIGEKAHIYNKDGNKKSPSPKIDLNGYGNNTTHTYNKNTH